MLLRLLLELLRPYDPENPSFLQLFADEEDDGADGDDVGGVAVDGGEDGGAYAVGSDVLLELLPLESVLLELPP